MTANELEDTLSVFRARLIDEGMHPNTIYAYVRTLKHCLMRVPELLVADATLSQNLIEDYLATCGASYNILTAQASLRKWHKMFFGYTIGRHRDNVNDFRRGPDIDAEISALRVHLEERGLVQTTIDATCNTVAMFLGWKFPDRTVEVSEINSFSIIDFITQRKSHLAISSMKTVATRLKRYLSFIDGQLKRRRSMLALNPPNWGNTPLPRILEDDEYESLIAYDGSERSAVVAAATALMGNLGLRCCEAVNLTIDDIDFINASVFVRATKGTLDRRIPLDKETGNALTHYLMNARPKSTTNRLFVRFKSHAGDAMTKSQLRGLMRYQARLVGIPDFGTHMLRRRSATKMVQAGVPIKVVADIMGHEGIQTTKGYLRMDTSHLRVAAGDWPGAING